MEIGYEATDSVREVIRSLGRTEDIRFSPSNRRLVIAEAVQNRIAIFDIDIAVSGTTKIVRLTGVVECSAQSFGYPHGLDFIDEETLVVGSRHGDIAMFKLPPAGEGGRPCELSPIQILPAGKGLAVETPGSVAIVRKDGASYEMLVCNNRRHAVTRHLVGLGADPIPSGETLLSKWLDIPDGICVTGDGRWIAVSNHNTHGVLVYENSPRLNPNADPDGILRCGYYPHGLRFSPDGRYLFVADAGAPYVHVFASDSQGWRGARNPVASFRAMDESTFARGRYNVHEGGPKGIDVDRGMNVLVTTSEHQPLAFFDLPSILANLHAGPEPLDVRYELAVLEEDNLRVARTRLAKARIVEAEARTVWAETKTAKARARAGFAIDRKLRRITALLSRVFSPLRG